jgi:hypothetical protein
LEIEFVLLGRCDVLIGCRVFYVALFHCLEYCCVNSLLCGCGW